MATLSVHVLLAVLAQVAPAGQRPPHPAVVATGSVPIKDWKPDSSLVVPETNIVKARFPAIEVHAHNHARTAADVAQWVRTMDAVGIETTVVLTGAVGAEFDRLADLYLRAHPKRFQLYAGILTDDVDAPDYPQRAADELERCYRKGARGLGELSDKGAGYVRGPVRAGARPLHPDDRRLDLFWQKAAQLHMPANIHMADHPSAWRPADNHQERSPHFQIYNQHGKEGPSYQEVLAIRDRLLARHPHNTFIACHLSNQGNDLASLSKALDRFPNLFLDIAARDYEIGRAPRAAARFLAKYGNRVLFGTDHAATGPMYAHWWRLLESSDEYMPGPNWWRLYGLELPAPILEALYRGNARRIMNWTPVGGSS